MIVRMTGFILAILFFTCPATSANVFDGCNACINTCMSHAETITPERASYCADQECRAICEKEEDRFREQIAASGDCGEVCQIAIDAGLRYCRMDEKLEGPARSECIARVNINFVNCINNCFKKRPRE